MNLSEKKYNIELDVIRVLSCAAVLLYHLGVLKGGYLAVCTFFVMSGYLACRSAFAQERFNIIKYYLNRLLHIYLPLAVVALVSVLVITSLPQIKWLNLKPETTSVLLGYNNYWQLSASLDYFARHVDSPFMHFWYIAIQLQFDLVFPFLFVILRWFKKKLGLALPGALLLISSAVSMLWFYILGSKGQVMEAYYSTAARCFALLLGMLMGFFQDSFAPLSFKFERKPAVARTFFCVWLAVWCGLVYISDAASEYFPHIMLAFTIISMRLINLAVLCGSREPSGFGRLMRGLASISYEVYLWQYPVIFLAQELVPATFDPILKYILMVVLILVLSVLLHFATGFKLFAGRRRAAVAHEENAAENARLQSPAEKAVPHAAEYAASGQQAAAVQASADPASGKSPVSADLAVRGTEASITGSRLVPDAAEYSAVPESGAGSTASGEASGRVIARRSRKPSRSEKYAARRKNREEQSSASKADSKTEKTASKAMPPREKKQPRTKKAIAVLAVRLVVFIAVIAAAAFGGWRFYKAEDHTAELAAMEAMMEENAAMMAERQKEFAQKQAQEAAAWEAALADFDSGEEKIKESVAALPVVGLGDSVMLGAVPALYETFPGGYFDAAVSRSAWAVRGILADLAEQGVSYDTVVMNFGANGDCPDEEKERIMEDLAGKHVYWLTNTNERTLFVNDRIRALAERYPNLKIIDWNAVSRGHGEYFYADDIHLTDSGRKAFARTVFDAIYQDRLAEWQAARDEFIRKHDEEYQKTLAFYGDHALLGIYEQLRQSAAGASGENAPDLAAAQYNASENYDIEKLRSDISAAAANKTLAYRVVLVFSKSLIGDASEIFKVLSQFAAQYPDHRFYAAAEANAVNAAMDTSASSENLQFIAFTLPEGTQLLMADEIHLTPVANQALAGAIIEELHTDSGSLTGTKYVFTDPDHSGVVRYSGTFYDINSLRNHNGTFAVSM